MMALIGSAVLALLPVLSLLATDYLKRRHKERDTDAPHQAQDEVDRELVTDKRTFAVRLSRLFYATRRDPRPPQ